MGRKKQFNFRWRYQTTKEIDKELIQYINNHPALPVTEIMLSAIRSFWLPMAIVNSDTYDEAYKKQITVSCVDALLRQADTLCAAVGLDLPSRKISNSSIESKLIISESSFNQVKNDGGEGSEGFNDLGLADW